MKVLTGAAMGLAAVTALTVPGALYMSNARRPVINPTEYVTVTVPGPTVTVTRWEIETKIETETEYAPTQRPHNNPNLFEPNEESYEDYQRDQDAERYRIYGANPSSIRTATT